MKLEAKLLLAWEPYVRTLCTKYCQAMVLTLLKELLYLTSFYPFVAEKIQIFTTREDDF